MNEGVQNDPPIADAGSNQTVTDSDNSGSESVTLNGSGSSDPDGSITSYIWREGGSQIASGATPSVNLSVGTHTITLTVTDNDGATDTDDVIITVNAGSTGGDVHVWLEAECGNVGSLWNTPSDGNASNDEYVTIQSGNNSTSSAPTSTSGHITYDFDVDENGSYTIWGRVIAPSASDDSYWVRMDGGAWIRWNNIASGSSWHWDEVHDADNNNQVVSFNLSAGNHTLTVAYREDGTQLDKIYITNTGDTPSGEGDAANNCTAVNQPPVANAGSNQTVTDSDNSGSESVTLNGSGSDDPDGSITSYIWREGGSQIASGVNPSVNLSVGTHTITLTVTDNDGATDTDDVIITVNAGSTGGDVHVWLEAECGNVGSLWNTPSDGNASNDEYVTIQSGNNSTSSAPTSTSGHITYDFDVDENGSYTIWGRVIAPSASDDSYWVRMDGGAWIRWNNIASGSSWHWDEVHDADNGNAVMSYNLSAGSHTLTIAYREDGTELDKLYITNTSGTPSGEGSAASNCGGSGTNDYSITVRARGTDGSEHISLIVGGTTIASWTLSTSYQNYTTSTDLGGAINVEFDNDDGTVRDVQVDYIQVDGSTWQAEDQSTNTGVWQDGSCGGSYSEWLHCAGYIGFNAYKSVEVDRESVTDAAGNAAINVYPNPAYDELFIELTEIDQNSIVIRIYTLAGVIIKSIEINEQNPIIDIGDLHPGYYFITINHNSKCYTSKFFKM